LSFGGTATVNNILYCGVFAAASNSIPNLSTSPAFVTVTTASSFQVGGILSGSTAYRAYVLSGTVSINTGGTFIPQYTLSVAPGGAYTTQAGSYLAIWPIGAAGANTSVGPWA
jgi:hypothetical protein